MIHYKQFRSVFNLSDIEVDFLTSWKAAILSTSPDLFCTTEEEVLAAIDKNELRPHPELEKFAAPMSRGEKILLGVMLSFFNTQRGHRYLEKIGCHNICDISARLDAKRRAIVASLLLTYSGW